MNTQQLNKEQGVMKLKEFEDMTIKQLKELTKQFKEQNPDTPTAEELLENLRKELNKND